MRVFLIATLGLLLWASCQKKDTENTMTLKGGVKGLKKGVLYLQKVSDTSLITVDSLRIDGNGDFSFKTELESPEIFYLYLDKKDNNTFNDRISFFGEPGTITINTSWKSFEASAEIKGSEATEKLLEFRNTMSRFHRKNIEWMQQMGDREKPLDQAQIDSINALSIKNVQREYAYALNFALNNKNSHVAPYILMTEAAEANVKYLDSIYGELGSGVADSKYGRQLKAHIAKVKAGKGP